MTNEQTPDTDPEIDGPDTDELNDNTSDGEQPGDNGTMGWRVESISAVANPTVWPRRDGTKSARPVIVKMAHDVVGLSLAVGIWSRLTPDGIFTPGEAAMPSQKSGVELTPAATAIVSRIAEKAAAEWEGWEPAEDTALSLLTGQTPGQTTRKDSPFQQRKINLSQNGQIIRSAPMRQ